MSTPPPVGDLSYEEARDELTGIVGQLEGGEVTLEESLGLWERGEALALRCQELLEGARQRIEKARGVDAADGATPAASEGTDA